MNELKVNEDDEHILSYTIPDEIVERAASNPSNERTGIFTQWMCTALFYCPGP
jgi:hypothetical protein